MSEFSPNMSFTYCDRQSPVSSLPSGQSGVPSHTDSAEIHWGNLVLQGKVVESFEQLEMERQTMRKSELS